MIMITVGSQQFQFNRLLKAVDQQVGEGKIKDRIFAQIGASDYFPKNYDWRDYLDRDGMEQVMGKARIVITHGGTGTIIGAIKQGKKVIAVPRLKEYGEHVDNHQLQLVGQFRGMNMICECLDCDKLWKLIREVKDKEFNDYESNTDKIIKSIDSFISRSVAGKRSR